MVEAQRAMSMTQEEIEARYSIVRRAIVSNKDVSKMKKAIDYYFRVHEKGKKVPHFSNDQEVVNVMGEIGIEILNRDYIVYVSTGTWGTTSSEMVRILS